MKLLIEHIIELWSRQIPFEERVIGRLNLVLILMVIGGMIDLLQKWLGR